VSDSLFAGLYTPEVSCEGTGQSALLRGGNGTPHSELPPEHQLMVALVMDAVECVVKYRDALDARGKRRFAKEAEWILSDDTSRLYAFARICESLDLNPQAVRRSLGLEAARARTRPRATARRVRRRRPCSPSAGFGAAAPRGRNQTSASPARN